MSKLKTIYVVKNTNNNVPRDYTTYSSKTAATRAASAASANFPYGTYFVDRVRVSA